MEYEYDDIVQKWFEELKTPFINLLCSRYKLGYDDAMDIYCDTWTDVYDNIKNGKVQSGTNWKAYIFRMGLNKANKLVTRGPQFDSIDAEAFNQAEFDKAYNSEAERHPAIYRNPEVLAVLQRVLSYIPDPCNTIFNLYINKFTMEQIAGAMNYKNADTAKNTKKRCMDKLRNRVMEAVRLSGVFD